MNPSTIATGSWIILALLLAEIILEGAASRFRSFDQQHEIKCVNGYRLFSRERMSRGTCLFLCYTKHECAGATFNPNSGACYCCGLFSEVAPGSDVDLNVMVYTYSDKRNTIVAARINSATGDTDSGRIEIRYNGTWGAICDDRWVSNLNGHEQNNINVMCNMLGFPSGGKAMISWLHPMPKDVGLPIWMDDVECSGTEVTIVDCPFKGFGIHECQDDEYLGLQCYL